MREAGASVIDERGEWEEPFFLAEFGQYIRHGPYRPSNDTSEMSWSSSKFARNQRGTALNGSVLNGAELKVLITDDLGHARHTGI